MPYTALPDRRMPYDADGTVVGQGPLYSGDTGNPALAFGGGVTMYPTTTQLQHIQDYAQHSDTQYQGHDNMALPLWFFFPGETRNVTAIRVAASGGTLNNIVVQGSTDTTNGVDGTWETATVTGSPMISGVLPVDYWRSAWGTVSFTGAKKVIRVAVDGSSNWLLQGVHLYGHKAAGQTADDILFLDADDGGAEFTAPEDFGDRPLGTTTTRTFTVKNVSATKSANNVVLACSDADFVLSADGGTTWVTSITVTLAAGATSATYTVRDTTPNPGAALGPRFARITATVTSWT